MTQEEQLKKDEQYMRKALVEAQQAYDEGEIPVGAVIVCNDRIISRAHNLTETLCDVTAHAEMQAITSAANMIGGKYLTNCTLYVTVEPCPMCAGAIWNARLSRVVYGAKDARAGAMGSVFNINSYPVNWKPQLTTGVLAEECRAVLQEFFGKKRRTQA